MQIGEAIKNLRKKKQLKQKDLSELCNISQTYLSQIENNKKSPNFEIIKTIGKELEMPLPVILFLALDEQDVSDDKRDLFNLLNPAIEEFINKIFINK